VSITAVLGVLTVHFESANKTHKSHVTGKLKLEDARLVEKLLARTMSTGNANNRRHSRNRTYTHEKLPAEDRKSKLTHQGSAHKQWTEMLDKHVKGAAGHKNIRRGERHHKTDTTLPSTSLEEAFRNHPSHQVSNSSLTLVQYMSYLAKLPQCQKKPIFVTMARVQDDLYWQLIENFFYSMLRFGHLDCSVMICISDSHCQQMCAEYDFPCYDYRHPHPEHHVMEQVAYVKLLHIGDALEAGVNILVLDLDVGFLRDPLLLVSDDSVCGVVVGNVPMNLPLNLLLQMPATSTLSRITV
jgi:hypothetical protein